MSFPLFIFLFFGIMWINLVAAEVRAENRDRKSRNQQSAQWFKED